MNQAPAEADATSSRNIGEVAPEENGEVATAPSESTNADTLQESPGSGQKRKKAYSYVTSDVTLTAEKKCKRCEVGPKYKKGHHISCPKSAYYGLGSEEAVAQRSRSLPTTKPKSKASEKALAALGASKKQEKAADYLVEKAQQQLQEAQVHLSEALEKRKLAQDAVEDAKNQVVHAELAEPCEWNTMFLKLKAYKEQTLNILFPRGCQELNKDDENYQTLCQWVKFQRNRRDKTKWQRKAALDSLGFVWDPFEATWRFHYGELLVFQEEHGHCNVPTPYAKAPYLPTFVATQRKNYRLFQSGTVSQMTLDRLQLLEDIGFEWTRVSPVRTKWQAMYDDLVAYHKVHGDCNNVPKIYEPSPKLRAWTWVQRTHYRLLKQGKPSTMNQERIKLMEEIGFDWNDKIKPTDDPGDVVWHQQFRELDAYRKIHGSCKVLPYPQNKALLDFADRQRQDYALLKSGQPSSMTQLRMNLLTGIGFDWTVVPPAHAAVAQLQL